MRLRKLRPIFGLLVFMPLEAKAQVAVAASANTASGDAASGPQLSDTADALPGIHRVGVAGIEGPRFGVAGHLGYGFTESQYDEDNSHHRIGGSLAAGVAPWSFAALALRLDLRHDIHGEDLTGEPDSGTAIDITPHLRFGGDVGSGVHLGAEGRFIFPGAANSDGIPAPQVDARALASYLGLPSWAFAAHAGYKLGVSDTLVGSSASLRPGDRVTLGLSEFDAVLIGLGALKNLGSTDVFGEVTWDLLVGSDAPSATESPFRISLGARQALARGLWAQGVADISPMGRAPAEPGDPLVPIEPRFALQLGVIYRWMPPEPVPVVEEKKPEPETKPEPEEKPEPEKPKAAPTSRVEIRVVDNTGHPISDATVTLVIPGKNGAPPEKRVVPLESENLYVLDGVPVGEAELVIEADLLTNSKQTIKVEEGAPAAVDIKLEPEGDLPSQLRGLVRSYSGQGVEASITITPGDHSTKCDAEGRFEIELPPGNYEVTISADGYQTQKRSLRVQDEGVTVLNADLQKSTQ